MVEQNTPKKRKELVHEKLKHIETLIYQVEELYTPILLENLIKEVERQISKDKIIQDVKEKIKRNEMDETVLSIDEGFRRMIQENNQIKDFINDVNIYIQDPMVAKSNDALGIQPLDKLPQEPSLNNGPTSARLVICDFDVEQGVVYPPAVWNEKAKRFETTDGKLLDKHCSENNNFHQVNAWAVVQFLLKFFESPEVFGRLLPWGFKGNQLIIVPHAGFTPNAYYDRTSKSLQYYYLGETKKMVYNCLSFDVVAHEAGHAILDGIRPHYYEFTSLQTAAFHEFFADMTAMLGCLRNNVLRRMAAKITRGNLEVDNVITHLAEQFGNEVYQTNELRNMASQSTMSDIRDNSIPHDCSLVLTGAIFDLLKSIVNNYNATPLEKLWDGTVRTIRMAFSAVDFLPPVDVQFIDYAQAVLRCFLVDPSNSKSVNYQYYKDSIIDVFKRRGLDISNLSRCPDLKFTLLEDRRFWSPTILYHFLHQHRDALCIPEKQDFQVLDIYQAIKYDRNHETNICHIVVQYIWNEDIPLTEDRFGCLKGKVTELRCGGTLVFDAEGKLLSWMNKPGCEFPADKAQGEVRKKDLLDHIAAQVEAGRVGLEDDDEVQINGPWTPSVVATSREGKMILEISRPRLKTLDETESDGLRSFTLDSRFIR